MARAIRRAKGAYPKASWAGTKTGRSDPKGGGVTLVDIVPVASLRLVIGQRKLSQVVSCDPKIRSIPSPSIFDAVAVLSEIPHRP